MPYNDPQRKREWERLHRSQRLTRRRELRRNDAARKQAQPGTLRVEQGGGGFLIPVVAGGALAAYNPKLAMGVGSLTLIFAVTCKKIWNWWAMGAFMLILGLFFYWSNQSAEGQTATNVQETT